MIHLKNVDTAACRVAVEKSAHAVRKTGARCGDLAEASFAAKLSYHLVDLRDSRGPERVALRQQAATRRNRQSTTQRGLAVRNHASALTSLAEH